MRLLSLLASKLLDALDIIFDALIALWRVLLRGAFAPDAISARNPRFVRLTGEDVLVRSAALNAADAGEAKRAIMLDPERYAPLSRELAAFDVVGPADEAQIRSTPERTFWIGVVRKDALTHYRTLNRKARAAEGFSYSPPQAPNLALLFFDDDAHRRRRRRRLLTAGAALLCAYSVTDLWTVWSTVRADALLESETAEAQAQRRARLAERRLQRVQTSLQTLSTQEGAPFTVVAEQFTIVANHLPASAEFTEARWEREGLQLKGRAFAPPEVELALRRSFQGARVSFASSGQAPAAFEAEITLSAPAATNTGAP